MAYSKLTASKTWNQEQPEALLMGLRDFTTSFRQEGFSNSFWFLSSVLYSFASNHYRTAKMKRGLEKEKMILVSGIFVVFAVVTSTIATWTTKKLSYSQADVSSTMLLRIGFVKKAKEIAEYGIREWHMQAKRNHNRTAKALLLMTIGNCFMKMKEKEKAVACFGQVEKLFPDIYAEEEFRQLARLCRNLSEVHANMGDYVSAVLLRRGQQEAEILALKKEEKEMKG